MSNSSGELEIALLTIKDKLVATRECIEATEAQLRSKRNKVATAELTQ